MSPRATIAALRAGERPTGGLLHTCRLHALGSEAYGEEAVVERFRQVPVAATEPLIVERPGHLAIFAGADAVVADLAGDQVARLWRVGPGSPHLPEAGVSVVFDPDLAQARGDLAFDPRDHAQLVPEASARVEAIGRTLARGDRAYRARAFVLRAFGSADEGAALLALYRLAGEGARHSGFIHVAARWAGSDEVVVEDLAGAAAVAETPWTPRIA